MAKQKFMHIAKIVSMIVLISLMALPFHASGEVQPITELEDKLKDISAEEKAVLENLFTISQKIEELQKDIDRINGELDTMQENIDDLELQIDDKQKDYDSQLDILKRVLVEYQRGGPASYVEILLRADNITEFLKSINLIKDISRNVGELLTSLEEGKKELQAQKDTLAGKVMQLQAKKEELEPPLEAQQKLKAEQEEYLASLKEDREKYQGQLDDLVQVWEDCKLFFPGFKNEIAKIVSEGNFTAEDLNLNIGFFTISGAIHEDIFNAVLKEHSDITEAVFHFYQDRAVIEVPEKHLTLSGTFTITGDTSIQFDVKEGSFYELPLQEASIQELFADGPFRIDFKEIAGDNVTINFTLSKVWLTDGRLEFEIKPQLF